VNAASSSIRLAIEYSATCMVYNCSMSLSATQVVRPSLFGHCDECILLLECRRIPPVYALVKGKAKHYQVITFFLKGYPLTRIMFNDLLLVRNLILYLQSEQQNVTPCASSFMQMQKQLKQDLVLCSFTSDKKEASGEAEIARCERVVCFCLL
jgi:hypothetical protein